MRTKRTVQKLMNAAARVFGAENVVKAEAYLRYGRKINLDCPKTLSDKTCFVEFRCHDPRIVRCSDKYEVRSFVKEKGLERILVPLIGDVYSDADEIDFDALPDRFVLKATFGSAMNLICTDKSSLDREKARAEVDRWMREGFVRDALEPHYRQIPRRFICEKYLDEVNGTTDYKIQCFNGRPVFFLACTERSKAVKLNLYTLDWKPIDGLQGKKKNTKQLPRPEHLEEMVEIARVLSQDFDSVRVDLYDVGGQVYFGELTFTPDRGIMSYYTDEFDAAMGEKLVLHTESLSGHQS